MKPPLFRQAVVDRLSSPEELDQFIHLTSPRSWLLLAAVASVLVGIGVWSIFGVMLVTVSGKGLLVLPGEQPQQAKAVLYLPFDEGTRVQPGMSVQLVSLAAGDGSSIAIAGHVATVGALPATRAQMLNTLGNDAYVQLLVEQGALTEVQITIDGQQLPTPGSRGSQALAAQAAQPIAGTITLARQRPLNFVFPSN